jgi:hypothetical protein
VRRLERSDDAEPAHPFDIFQTLHPQTPRQTRHLETLPTRRTAQGRLTHQDLRMLDSPLDLTLRLAHLCVVVAISTLREGHVPQERLVDVQHDRVGAVTDPVRAELETLYEWAGTQEASASVLDPAGSCECSAI